MKFSGSVLQGRFTIEITDNTHCIRKGVFLSSIKNNNTLLAVATDHLLTHQYTSIAAAHSEPTI